MDFRELIYITTIADTGNITTAAKKLYMSQPALSQLLAKTEQELGVKLFQRNRGPLVLTYAGERYVHTAKKILAMNSNLRRELADICGGETGEIRVGIPAERSGYTLPMVLPKFRAYYPHVRVRTIEEPGAELIEALQKGKVDFVVLPYSEDLLTVGMKTEKIYQERITLVINPELLEPDMLMPGHPNVVQLNKMQSIPMIQQRREQSTRRRSDSILKRYGIVPEIIAETSSSITAVQLAAAGLGYAIVPQRAPNVLRKTMTFQCYDFDTTPETWDIHVGYMADTYLDKVQRCFIDLMKDIAPYYNGMGKE